ncbi:MAG: TlpA family protein disulfide reductase [Actinomycetota bacterium]
MPPTRSSPDPERRPSRRAIVALIAISIAIPLALLAIALTGERDDEGDATVAPVGECAARAAVVGSGTARVGAAAPDFRLETLACQPFRLADLRGAPVVLTFFASWCHPCEDELRLLEEAFAEKAGAFTPVAVSYQDLRTDSTAFVERLGVSYPALFDVHGDVAEAYGVHGIPQTFFIDADGIVRDRVFGIATRAELREPLDALLQRSDSPVARDRLALPEPA